MKEKFMQRFRIQHYKNNQTIIIMLHHSAAINFHTKSFLI